jgi:hypothetical protein
MNRYLLIAVSLMLVCPFIPGAEEKTESKQEMERLFFIKKGDKIGHMNAKGEVVIEPKFEWAEDFTGKLARFKKGNFYGFINRKGEVAINPHFEFALPFSHGLAAVYMDGKWGFIDTKGDMVIKAEYVDAKSFSEGVAAVCKLQSGRYRKWGYIDTKGKEVLPFNLGAAHRFSEGFAAVIVPKGRKGTRAYIDKEGKILFEITTGRTYIAHHQFSEGLVGVFADYYNTKGEKEFSVEGVGVSHPFNEGYAAAKVRYSYGFINKKGEWIIKPKYGSAYQFSQGLARVRMMLKGAKYSPWGYINSAGEEVIKLQFSQASDFFKEGIARVVKDGKYGYINKKGEYVWREE